MVERRLVDDTEYVGDNETGWTARYAETGLPLVIDRLTGELVTRELVALTREELR